MKARPSTATSSGDFPSKKPSVLRSTRRSKTGRTGSWCSTGETSTDAGPTLSSVAGKGRARRSSLGEHRAQRAEGPTPVADAVLLLVGELSHRLLPAGGHEDGVVAEPARAPTLRHDRPFAGAVGVGGAPVGPRDGGDASVPGRAPPRGHA